MPINAECFEARTLLSGSSPVFATVPTQSVLSGSPLMLPIDGSDADGGPLTYTVTVTGNTASLTANVRPHTDSLKISVAGQGDMLFHLFDDLAPRVTDQIKSLAESGFYDGTIFHRVINNFMIQGGDPTGTGTGGSTLGAFDDQFHPDLQHNRTGLLSMAKSEDDSNDSQFFITEGAQRHLDFNHSIFGVLVEGDSVRDAISNVATGANDRPVSDVTMTAVDVVQDDENAVLFLKAPEGATGQADITLRVTDSDGNFSEQVFHVSVTADTIDSSPYLDDVPRMRTITNPAGTGNPVSLQYQLTAIDADPSAAAPPRFLYDSNETPTNLGRFLNFTTGLMSATPSNGMTGSFEFTVATAAYQNVFDIQGVSIEVVSTAQTLAVSADDDPRQLSADDGQPDSFLVRANNGLLEVLINGRVAVVANPNSVADLIINGSSDRDTLTIDYTIGSPIPQGGIKFLGGSQPDETADRLVLKSATLNNVVHSLTNQHAGSVATNGATVVTYDGCELVQDQLAVAQRGFQFGDSNDEVTLTDDILGGGISMQLQLSGVPRISFLAPTSAMEIGLGAGDDFLKVLDVGLDFESTVAMTVLGDSGDDIMDLEESSCAFFISGGEGRDSLRGTNGDDVFLVEPFADAGTQGTAGQSPDVGTVDISGDTLDGGDGTDLLLGQDLSGQYTLLDSLLYGATDWQFHELFHIETANFSAADEGLSVNASEFTGPVTLTGGDGTDSLHGGEGTDLIAGGAGNDTLGGGLGNDTLSGGSGTDVLAASGDVNFTLTTSLLTGLGSDSFSNFEGARLTGGAGANNFNTTGFSGPVTLDGAEGNDTLQSGSGKDSLLGGTGDDSLLPGGGDDSAFGGDGNDTLLGGSGVDSLSGESGNDRVDGQGGNGDCVSGGIGDDVLIGGTGSGDKVMEIADVALLTLTNAALIGLGNDTLNGIEAAQLAGGAGNNTIDGSAFTGPMTLLGGDGNDSLLAAAGNDKLDGEAGNDTLVGGSGSDTLAGGVGNDVLIEVTNGNVTVTATQITGSIGTDTYSTLEGISLTGGAAANKFDLTAFTGKATLSGGAGNDTLFGGSGDDNLLDNGGGDDSFVGNGGNDSLFGGMGKDSLIGGDGDDKLFGQGGSGDILTGGAGNDTIDGGAGTDALTDTASGGWTLTNTSLVGNGNDVVAGIEQATLVAGSGNDLLDVSAFGGPVTMNGNLGNDTLIGSAFNDFLVGWKDNDSIVGGGGNDSIKGGLGNDTLTGDDGNDTINGGDGNDQIDGGNGDDKLAGTLGNDLMLGGAGLDSIVGGDGNDTLQGGADSDSIIGGLGTDSIDGQDGTDRITGGTGNGSSAQASDTVVGSASEISNALTIVGTWIDSV